MSPQLEATLLIRYCTWRSKMLDKNGVLSTPKIFENRSIVHKWTADTCTNENGGFFFKIITRYWSHQKVAFWPFSVFYMLTVKQMKTNVQCWWKTCIYFQKCLSYTYINMTVNAYVLVTPVIRVPGLKKYIFGYLEYHVDSKFFLFLVCWQYSHGPSFLWGTTSMWLIDRMFYFLTIIVRSLICSIFSILIRDQAAVVQRADNSIHGISRYPTDEMDSNQYIFSAE